MDGWEDDDDLDIDSDAGNENQEWKNDLQPSAHDDDGGGDWSFDDNVILDDEKETLNESIAKTVLIETKKQPSKSAVPLAAAEVADGGDQQQEESGAGNWSFDDELLDDDEEEETTKRAPVPTVDKTNVVSSSNGAAESTKPPASSLFDRLANDDTMQRQTINTTAKTTAREEEQTSNKPAEDEWSFEDDSFLDEPTITQPSAPPSEKQEQTFQNLVRYIETLPALLPSLNALLEAEYNTFHHAIELTEYYKSRPQLYEYTLDTELPRMEYQVVLPNQKCLTDKYQVQQYLLAQKNHEENNILIRSANQSLLADLLAQLSGPDRFIQHQHLATAVATSCHFVIHPSFVECHCLLTLSLPSATGDRLDVARLKVSIDFGQPPSVTYRLHEVERIIQDLECLRETAAFLSSLEDDSFVEEEAPANDDLVRDAFMAKLSQTQQFVEDSHAGLSSAWKQIDSVANVSKKMSFLKKGLTNLPTTETLEKVAAVPAPSQSRRPPPPPPPPPHKAYHRPLAPPKLAQHIGGANPLAVNPPPPPSNVRRGPPAHPPETTGDRPAPILGGLLRSGWNRLAQTVTLPDEEQHGYPSAETPAIPKLYRPENTAMKDTLPVENRQAHPPPISPQQRQQNSMLQPQAPPPKVANDGDGGNEDIAQAAESALHDGMQDGWGDDDLELGDDDDDLLVDKSKPLPSGAPLPSRYDSPQPTPAATLPPPKPPQAPVLPAKAPPASTIVDSPPGPVVEYNPDDDIVPTRKRWVNPRPGNRQLRV